MGDGADATNAGDDRNNGERLDLARLLSRSGKRAAIDDFLLSVRCPEPFSKLPEKRRRETEASNAALRARFSREVLALIVALQECILTAYVSRRAFVDRLQDLDVREVNTTFLSRRLGGDCDRGPHGAWWLLELIAEHCACGDDVQDLRRRFARLWHAAYGQLPEPVLGDLGGSLVPVTEREIAKLIDPPQEPAPSPRAVPAAGSVLIDVPDGVPLFDALPNAVLFVDTDSTVVHSNSAARELFDTAGGDLAGRGVLDLLPSFDVRRLARLADSPAAESAGERQPPVRVAARRTDGRDVPAEVHSTRLKGGRVARAQPSAEGLDGEHGSGLLMVVVRDLTGAQDLETQLLRQQRQYEAILQTASEGVLHVDAEGRIAQANDAAAAALGHRPGELDGRLFHTLMLGVRVGGTPMPYTETPVGQALGSGRPCRSRGHVLRAKDGRPVHVDLSATPVREAGPGPGSGAVITFAVRQPAGRLLARELLTAEQALDAERAQCSRMRAQLVEYHQLLIQVLARLDGPGTDTVQRLCGGLLHADRQDLLRSARAVRDLLPAHTTGLTLAGAHGARLGAGAVALDQVVADAVESASVRIGPGTRFLAYAPRTAAEVDGPWLSGVLAQLIVAAVATGTTGSEPVVVSAAQRRGEIVRIDVSGSFTSLDRARLARVREKVRAHGGVLHTVEVPRTSGSIVVVLEVPLGVRTADGADGSGQAEGSDRAAVAEPGTQITAIGRGQINVPESSPGPPVVVRRPFTLPQARQEPEHTEGATVSRWRQLVGRSKKANQRKLARAGQLVTSAGPTEADEPPPVPDTSPGRRSTPLDATSTQHDFGELPPLPPRTVQLVSGDFLLTVNPVDGSEIEVCPPGERPQPPAKFTAAERAETARAGRSPLPPGPALPRLPLLERQEERERLVRLLARGRSVRLTGPSGSGRTALLDAVAEDCADLAPDGVIRLSGYRQSADDLLHDLFAAVYNSPLYRPGRDELLRLVGEIGAVVVLDDVEFGGAALDDLLIGAPECAFLVSATPEVPAPLGDSLFDEVAIGGLDLAGGLELMERAVGRALTEEESNWAGDIWFESEGLPLRFVQAGALLRQRDELRADADAFDTFSDVSEAGDGPEVPLPSLAEGAAPAALLASRLSESARETLKFAVALGGEVPHQAHLPALVGDTHADAALGELAGCSLVSPVGSRYRLAAGVRAQLEAAGYATGADAHALSAARHYSWWAGHPSVTPERVCAEADAVLAALTALVPLTTPPGEDEESAAVQLARQAAPAFAAGLHWSAWERCLRAGAEATRLAGEVGEQAYFHHELGILALCGGQLDRARAELEASIGLRGALADKRGTVAGRRALALVADRSGATPPGGRTAAGEEVPDARYEESASPPGGVPTAFGLPASPDEVSTLVTHQAGPGSAGGAPKREGMRGRLVSGTRRNLVAAGAGALLAAVLGTVVTLGATSNNDNNPPSEKVGVNPSASQGTDDDSLGADKAKKGGGDSGSAAAPTDPGPDGTYGTSDDPTPSDTEPSDDPSGTKGTPSKSPSKSPTTKPPTSRPPTSPTTRPPTTPPTTTSPSTGPTTTPPSSPASSPATSDSASGPASSSAPATTSSSASAPQSSDAGSPSGSGPVI